MKLMAFSFALSLVLAIAAWSGSHVTGVALAASSCDAKCLSDQTAAFLASIEDLTRSVIGPRPVAGDGLDGDYYVSPDGSDTNPGTIDQPFRTVPRALRLVKAGQTIYLREGVYPGFDIQNLVGRPDAPIRIAAFPGERAIIDAHLGAPGNFAIRITGIVSNLIIDGLEITDSGPALEQARALDLTDAEDYKDFIEVWEPRLEELFAGGVRMSPPSSGFMSNLTFRNLKIYHLGQMGFLSADRVQNVVIENSLIRNLGRPRSGYGVYYHGENFIFRNNVVDDAVYGLHMYTGYKTVRLDHAVIENNIFTNIGIGRYWHMASDTLKTGGVAILADDPGSNVIIRNNIIRNCAIGISVDVDDSWVLHNETTDCGTGISLSRSTVTVANNVLRNAPLSGRPATAFGNGAAPVESTPHELAPTDIYGEARGETVLTGPIENPN